MSSLYEKPLRVYIILGALAIWGIISGFNLPISLFPNSSQVIISARVPTGSFSSQQFFEVYGNDLEANFQSIKIDSTKVKNISADYRNRTANYKITFEWGADPIKSMAEVNNVINARMASAGEDVRRDISVNIWSENRGFFAISFYSPMRSLDDLYETLEPMISPVKSKIEDAGEFGLWNPNSKEVTVSLIPEKLAQYELNTIQIQHAIGESVIGLTGGTLKLGEKDYVINFPKNVSNFDLLSQIRVSDHGKAPIFLKDVATITLGVSKDRNSKFKTSGVESLILFASPKEGGNIKQMADQIMAEMEIQKKCGHQMLNIKF